MKQLVLVWTIFSVASSTTLVGEPNFAGLPSLSEITISNDEILEPWNILLGTAPRDTPLPAQIDVTDELAGNCAKDCVKKIWIAHRGNAVTLMMIRASSSERAVMAIANLWNIYSQLDGWSFWAEDEFTGPSDNSWLGEVHRHQSNSDRFHFILAMTRGPVILIAIQRIENSFLDDPGSYRRGLEYLADLQLQKLESAGYPPQ